MGKRWTALKMMTSLTAWPVTIWSMVSAAMMPLMPVLEMIPLSMMWTIPRVMFTVVTISIHCWLLRQQLLPDSTWSHRGLKPPNVCVPTITIATTGPVLQRITTRPGSLHRLQPSMMTVLLEPQNTVTCQVRFGRSEQLIETALMPQHSKKISLRPAMSVGKISMSMIPKPGAHCCVNLTTATMSLSSSSSMMMARSFGSTKTRPIKKLGIVFAVSSTLTIT